MEIRFNLVSLLDSELKESRALLVNAYSLFMHVFRIIAGYNMFMHIAYSLVIIPQVYFVLFTCLMFCLIILWYMAKIKHSSYENLFLNLIKYVFLAVLFHVLVVQPLVLNEDFLTLFLKFVSDFYETFMNKCYNMFLILVGT